MKILGIDYGDRYIGFAECDPDEIIAYPLGTAKVKSMREAIDAAAEIAARDGAELIVVGLPLLPDGTEGARASKTRAFGGVLSRVAGLSVEYSDERLTTLQAEEYLAQGGVGKRDVFHSLHNLLRSVFDKVLVVPKNEAVNRPNLFHVVRCSGLVVV